MRNPPNEKIAEAFVLANLFRTVGRTTEILAIDTGLHPDTVEKVCLRLLRRGAVAESPEGWRRVDLTPGRLTIRWNVPYAELTS